jgi:hypothetical protein
VVVDFFYFIRFKRERARIEAWENLQRARAEAELKRVEVKWPNLETNPGYKNWRHEAMSPCKVGNVLECA